MPLHGFTAVDLGYQQGNAVSNLVDKLDEPTLRAVLEPVRPDLARPREAGRRDLANLRARRLRPSRELAREHRSMAGRKAPVSVDHGTRNAFAGLSVLPRSSFTLA